MTEEPPVFTQHTAADGGVTITISHWPDTITVDLHMLALARNRELFGMWTEGDRLIMDVANGRGEYQMGPVDEWSQVRHCHRIYLKEKPWTGQATSSAS